MTNNIRRFLLPQLAIPAVGLLLALGFISKQSQPVLSNQLEETSTSSARFQKDSETSILSRLREVREQRQAKVASRSKMVQKIKQSKAKTNRSPQQSKLISSTALANRKRTAPTTTAMVAEPQQARNQAGILPRTNLPRTDGIYLYGQSPQPNQPGQGYIIFQKRRGNVTGALYMPRSEFSCFRGTLDRSGELAMTVNSTPDGANSSQVAATSRLPRVPNDEFSTYAHSVTLQEYYKLNSISASDRRMLRVCNQSS
ncbi:MAG: hypothetical protein KME21_27470 [Desmonostoc vinosum HA7617-LM4]|nr:hypothetical protein [Desmonostoc vinosum HA7617-LM4]